MAARPQTKYQSPDLAGPLTDDTEVWSHAIGRYRERTPDSAPMFREAFALGSDIDHPSVAKSDAHPEPPARARVYRHGQQWGVVWLIYQTDTPGYEFECRTTVALEMYSGPKKSYLWDCGPHYRPDGYQEESA